jgi:hypothetical protein
VEIYQDGNLSWQDQQAASWILITSEKTAWMYNLPLPTCLSMLPMNVATAWWQQQMTMASADLKTTAMFQWLSGS